MAYLRIYSGDKLLEQRELSSERTTIGRAKDNDIVLPSNGVSKHHAIIERDGQSYVLIDNDSANGVYVNGERIQRHKLKYWDEIQIFNHVVKFMALTKLQGEESGVLDQSNGRRQQQETTMEVDISSLGDLVKLRKKANVASLSLTDAEGGTRRHELDRGNFTIGKARECNIRVPGWLAPRLAALVQRRNDGFYLIPGRRGKVSINGAAVAEPVKLSDGDDLQVRGLKMKFCFRPLDDA